MRFLVDNNLSWRLCRALNRAGHDAVHVAERGLDEGDDAVVAVLTSSERRVIITRDSDFETLLPAALPPRASGMMLRTSDGRPEAEAAAILACLPGVQADLEAGAFVVIEDSSVRCRRY